MAQEKVGSSAEEDEGSRGESGEETAGSEPEPADFKWLLEGSCLSDACVDLAKCLGEDASDKAGGTMLQYAQELVEKAYRAEAADTTAGRDIDDPARWERLRAMARATGWEVDGGAETPLGEAKRIFKTAKVILGGPRTEEASMAVKGTAVVGKAKEGEEAEQGERGRSQASKGPSCKSQAAGKGRGRGEERPTGGKGSEAAKGDSKGKQERGPKGGKGSEAAGGNRKGTQDSETRGGRCRRRGAWAGAAGRPSGHGHR